MNSPIKTWREHTKASGKIGMRGKIVSWTVIRTPPEGFEDQPFYPVVLVELEGGTKILTHMVDYTDNQLKIGQKVVIVIRKLAKPLPHEVITYGIKVKPV